jgi:hypothetical protein
MRRYLWNVTRIGVAAAGCQNQTPTLQRAIRDYGWKDGDRGGSVKKLGSTERKRKIDLTRTCLLMEGVSGYLGSSPGRRRPVALQSNGPRV